MPFSHGRAISAARGISTISDSQVMVRPSDDLKPGRTCVCRCGFGALKPSGIAERIAGVVIFGAPVRSKETGSVVHVRPGRGV